MKQLNKLTTLVLMLLMLGSGMLEAQTIVVGTATGSNPTSGASPINIWYRSMHYQTVYTAAELTSAGASAGTILQLGFNITGLPTYALPNYTIKMKHTTAANAAAYDGAGLMQVYNTPSYMPTLGFDMVNLQTPFAWNGTDNILIDVCFDQVTNYTQTGTVGIYTATNGAHYIRNDNSSQCGVATNTPLGEKPVIQLTMGTAPSCAMTGLPTFSGTTSASTTASWTTGGTPTSYLVEYGPVGFTPGTGTFLTPTTQSVTLSGLTPATDYSIRVQAVCGTAVGDTSFAAIGYFSTSCPATLVAPITESFSGAGLSCLTTTNNLLNSGGGWPNVGWIASASSFYSAPSGYDAGKFLYFETSGATAGQSDILTFLPIDLTGLTSPFMDFFWYLDYQWSSSGSFDIQVQTNGTWTSVYTRSGGQNIYDWTYASVDLSAYAGTTIGLRIVGTASANYGGGAGIDRLRLREAPVSACPVVMAPDTLDFEDGGALNACWEQSTMDNMDWIIGGPGGTPSAATGPSGANTGTYYAYIESSSPASPGDSAILMSPPMNTGLLDDAPALYFSYHMRGNDYMRLRAEYEIFGSDIWIPIWEQEGAVHELDTDPYLEAYVPMPNAIGSTIRVRIIAIVGANDGVSTGAGTGFSSDIAIDDVRVQNVLAHDVAITDIITPGNACGLGVQPITIEVTNRGFNSQTGVPVFVSVNGGNPVGATITSTIPGNGGVATVDVLVDMSALGMHSVEAYTALALDEVANNNMMEAMAYHQPEIVGEYDQTFEGSNGYWHGTGDWEYGMPSGTVIDGAGAGDNAYVTVLNGNYADNKMSYLYSPCFDISAMTTPVLRFSINWDLEDDWDGAWLEYSVNGGTSWDKLGANNFAGLNWYTDSISNNPYGWAWSGTGANGSGGWVDAIIDLQPYGLTLTNSVSFRFVMAADASTNNEGVGIDNFGIYDGCLSVVMNETVVDETVAGLSNGSVTVNPVGGFGGYTYLWSNGSTSNSITGLAPGTYNVTVTDQVTCVTTATFTVVSLCPVSLGASVITTPEIDDADNGSALITASAGTAPYTYTWSNGTSVDNGFGLAAGTYTVTVTDANGCLETIDVVIDYLSGTENLKGLTGLSLSPNPAKDFAQLNINFEYAVDLTVKVIDVTGRVLETRNAGNTTSEMMRFDVSNLAEGVYFMQIIANGQTATQRFVIVK